MDLDGGNLETYTTGIWDMSSEPYLLHNAIDGVFLPRSPVPQRFCLPRSRGVPTSFYKLDMMFLTNRGTPEYYFPYTQIRAVAHMSRCSKQRKTWQGLSCSLQLVVANLLCGDGQTRQWTLAPYMVLALLRSASSACFISNLGLQRRTILKNSS